jgi:hypothetical protein
MKILKYQPCLSMASSSALRQGLYFAQPHLRFSNGCLFADSSVAETVTEQAMLTLARLEYKALSRAILVF